MGKIVHNHELHVYVTSKNCQNKYHKLCQYMNIQWTGSLQIQLFHLQIRWTFFAVVTAVWKFIIAEKSRISAYFLRADVRGGIRLKIFNNRHLLSWYIFCFFGKAFRQTGHFYFENISTREGRNDAAALNLLESDSLRGGVSLDLVLLLTW